MNREEEQQWNVEDEEGITAISLSSVRVTVTKQVLTVQLLLLLLLAHHSPVGGTGPACNQYRVLLLGG